MTSPEPGWYPDPDDQSVRLWWDGSRWTTERDDSETFAPRADFGSTKITPPLAVTPKGSFPTAMQAGVTTRLTTSAGTQGRSIASFLVPIVLGLAAAALVVGAVVLVTSETGPLSSGNGSGGGTKNSGTEVPTSDDPSVEEQKRALTNAFVLEVQRACDEIKRDPGLSTESTMRWDPSWASVGFTPTDLQSEVNVCAQPEREAALARVAEAEAAAQQAEADASARRAAEAAARQAAAEAAAAERTYDTAPTTAAPRGSGFSFPTTQPQGSGFSFPTTQPQGSGFSFG